MEKENLRIIFMGTPEFAVESLNILVENNYNIVGVITTADKASGRGRKINQCAVKKYAESKNLHTLQPTNLKDPKFIEELKSLNADLQIVVAFRMLPESVWNMPRLGTLNLHASLLPNYRGAAPINWAILNGEKETGVSTFFLKHKIDTGNIILQQKVDITETDNAGSLHDKLMLIGSSLILKTIEAIRSNNYSSIAQNTIIDSEIKNAPKIFKQDCLINFDSKVEKLSLFIRGLSPYPTAFTKISNSNKTLLLKIYDVDYIIKGTKHTAGFIESDNKSFIHIYGNNGYLNIKKLQLEGKKTLTTIELLRGFDISDYNII